MTATYKTGTAAVSNGSVNVVGTGTAWAVALVVGGMFSCDGLAVPIASIVDDTHLTLDYVWPGTTGAGKAYSIARENSDASNVVDLYDKLSDLLVTLSIAGIHPDNSGSLAKRDALTLTASNDNYLYLRAELGVEFAFYRWDGPSLAWIGPFTVADAVAGGGVSSIVGSGGVAVDATNPAIPVVKLANMATSRVKGRATAGTGAPEDLTLSQVLDMIGGAAQGDILYRGSATWQRLAAGTALQLLRMNAGATAVEWGAAPAQGREVLSANRTYFVRTDGSDANNGLANTVGGAFLTVQKAINVVAALDLSIFNVTIQIADGTYTGTVIVSGAWVGAGTVTIVGNVTTPSNVILQTTTSANGVIQCTNYGRISIQAFRVQATGAGIGLGINASNGGNISVLAGIDFGSCINYQINATLGGIVTSTAAYSISGGAQVHINVNSFAFARISGNTITISGTPVFANFASATRGGSIEFFSNTFAGTGATGSRYAVTSGSWLFVNGGAATYLPGSIAGTVTGVGSSYS